MSIANFLVEQFSLPAADWMKGTKVSKYFRFYKRTIHWSSEEIKAFQLKKLKIILQHAYDQVPLYRRKFAESNLTPQDIKSLEDLKKLPYLTRADIRDHLDELTPEGKDMNHVYKGTSSGSTGVPIRYYIGNNALSAGRAALYLGWILAGWRPGNYGLHIWGNPRVVKEQWQKKSSKLKDILFNHYKYPAYKLTEGKEFSHLVEKLGKDDYIFIDGYTTAIYLLARYIADQGISFKKYDYVLTTAETLQDYQRTVIDDNLGKVYDGYGCSEIEGIANQCRYCGEYHIIDPRVIVEFDDKNVNSDNSRPIIVTELDNFEMPFIRYKIGDLAVPSDSNNHKNCPVPFSRIHSISGRVSDIISLPGGGNLVVASFFGAAPLKKLEGKIAQYQVEKISHDKLNLKLKVNPSYCSKDESTIREYLDEYLGDKMKCDIILVDDIPPAPNGKYKLLIDNS